MCGSSSGGDGGASRREAERQAKMDAATAQIDTLFGIEGGNTARGYDPSRAKQNRLGRESLYGTVRSDVIKNFMRDLFEQHRNAGRQRVFSLADRGLTGGSVDIDTGQELQNRLNKGTLAVANKGDAAANEMRSMDGRTRLDILSRIQAGADAGTAMNSAVAEMGNNLNRARDSALGNNLNDFFGDLMFLQRARNDYLSGQRLQNALGNYFSPSTSTTGAGGGVTATK